MHTTLPLLKAQAVQQGCEIVHELLDATAVACPENVVVPNSEPDRILRIVDMSSDTQIRADQVWALGYTGSGVTVAVLDTGVYASHPELSSSIVGGQSFVSYTTSFADDNGHGTHVSGIITSDGIAQSYSRGVAYNAGVWMGKVCDASGHCLTSDMVAAIEYVVNYHVAKVMSISIGGGGTSGPNCDGDYLASRINWAYDNGVISVVAAGNNEGSIVDSPACASKAIAVAAVDSSDNLASFSNYGSALQDHGVAAPGANIYSTYLYNSYVGMSGTSMATPHVSATIALMLQENPSLTQADIRSTILSSANCLSGKYGSCPNIYIGYGRVDALNAVRPTFISTHTSTSYLSTTSTRTVTSYTSTTTLTSTIPTVTTVALLPLTVTSIVQSTQYLTSFLTTTVTSYTGTSTSTSAIVVPTTVTVGPSATTSTGEITQVLTSTGTTTVTSYTTTTVTSYTATTTSTSTRVVYTTVTTFGAGVSNSLVYLGLLALLGIGFGRVTAGGSWWIPRSRLRTLEGRCVRN